MPSLLEGQIRRWVHSGLKAGKVLLDVTVHQEAPSYTPGTGSTVTATNTSVPECGFPDEATGRFMANTNLGAGETLLVLSQKPLRAKSLTITENDSVTVRSVRYQLLEVTEDPAQAIYVCRAKGG